MNTMQDNKLVRAARATPENAAQATCRLSINITPAERVGRIVLGGLAALAGAILLTSAGSEIALILEVLLIAAGLDLVITGALGHCPLYQKLGHEPASLRRSQ